MEWIKPNTITGSAAEGNKYFRRIDIEDKIWHEISQSNHVLFLAPRRVGKSSIVMYMSNNPKPGFACKYEDIESDTSIQDFYKRLCRMTYEALSFSGKSKSKISTWWNSWNINSLGKDKIDLGKSSIDYRKEFFNILDDLKVKKEKVVLFLDEFPDVIWKISQRHGVSEAETLLADIRTLRQTKEFKDVFVMVLLGSVGLAHIVKKITGRTDKVNDLHKEFLPALKASQTLDFLDHLVKDATMKINDDTRKYIMEKIGHFIPFYIQLIIEECDELLHQDGRTELNKADIDKAYNVLLKKHQFFEDWDSRLSRYFPEKYSYLLEVLSKCAAQGTLTLQEIYDIGFEHRNSPEWKADIDDILVADGYLTENDEQYIFNSPLLRDWWKARHPIMKKS